jgi:hypothetical protein
MNEPSYWVDSKQKGVNVGGQGNNPPLTGSGRDGN